MKRTSSTPAPPPTSPSAPRRPHRLRRADLPTETVALARALVGKLLIRIHDGRRLVGRIVETEAYVPSDPASHAYRGPTPRNRAMFGAHLTAYVYFIYGTNWCLNVASECEGVGAAVLLRACEPVRGVATMRALRDRPALRDADLARGPGNLCRAFAIGPAFDGADLETDRRLMLADDGTAVEVATSVRIGITKAAEQPLRFYARGNASVSGPRALSP